MAVAVLKKVTRVNGDRFTVSDDVSDVRAYSTHRKALEKDARPKKYEVVLHHRKTVFL
jgi:hypothetical protein